ncbi:MAG TPA: MASE1 domain-containing protein, partial [Waterburya sp.]
MNLHYLMPLSQRRFWRYFTVISIIAIAYYGAAQLAVSTLRLGLEASPLWPAAGIALAALLLQGQRGRLGVALGSFVWCQSQVSWVMACALAFGITLQAFVGERILRWAGFNPSLKRLQDVLQLVVLGAWGSTLVNATLSTLIGYLWGTVAPLNWQQNWWTLWVGDGMGILVVTPLLLVTQPWLLNLRGYKHALKHGLSVGKLKGERREDNLQPVTQSNAQPTTQSHLRRCFNQTEVLICFTLLCVISWLVFGSKPGIEIARYPIEYLPFPLVVWAAIRFLEQGAVTATLIVSVIAIWGAVHGVGPFTLKTDIKQAVLFLQGFMGVVSITALVLAAAESERVRAVGLLQEREASLANAQRLAQLGSWDFQERRDGTSITQQKLRWSDELYRLFGFTPKAFEPSWEVFFQIVHPADRERVGQAIRGALRENQPYYLDYRIVLPDGSERVVCEQSEIYNGGIRGTVQDITERQRVEAQLRAAVEHVNESAERQRLLGEMALRIRRSLNLDQILNTTVAEVREFLKADRVFIGQLDGASGGVNVDRLNLSRLLARRRSSYEQVNQLDYSHYLHSFNLSHSCGECYASENAYSSLDTASHLFPEKAANTNGNRERDTNGKHPANFSTLTSSTRLQGLVIAESVDPCYPSLRRMVVDDETTLQEWRSLFHQGRVIVVEDTKEIACSAKIAAYHCEYNVAAILGVPIWVGDKLYGALVVNQCNQPRHWQSWEIEWLTSLATQVAIAIQQAELYRQITQLNTHLESQVEERTQELSAKMAELQELNHLKDVFLQAVSHDLRTSLLGVSMVFNNLYKSGEDSVTLCRPLLKRLITSNERQLNLINSLLEDYFNEQRQLELNCQSIQLNELIQDLIAQYSPLLAQNQATLTHKLPQNCPFITADPTQLRRVLENLLTNALKHNPPGLNLVLQVAVEDQKIRCTLEDNGVGMSQEQQKSLFKLYIRGLHTKHLTGIGLGLYHCRQIINAHGGEIGVMSA